jgi:DNA-binding HxlR family transcriptional regulator
MRFLYVLGLLGAAERPLRFGELKRSVEGMTQKSLTKTLRTLERDGFVDRRVHPTIPPRVEYRLTELGRDAGRPAADIEATAWTRRG